MHLWICKGKAFVILAAYPNHSLHVTFNLRAPKIDVGKLEKAKKKAHAISPVVSSHVRILNFCNLHCVGHTCKFLIQVPRLGGTEIYWKTAISHGFRFWHSCRSPTNDCSSFHGPLIRRFLRSFEWGKLFLQLNEPVAMYVPWNSTAFFTFGNDRCSKMKAKRLDGKIRDCSQQRGRTLAAASGLVCEWDRACTSKALLPT